MVSDVPTATETPRMCDNLHPMQAHADSQDGVACATISNRHRGDIPIHQSHVDDVMNKSTVKEIAITKFIENKDNPRKHTDDQIELLAEGIKRWGFTNPVTADEKYVVLAGHGRLAAAKRGRD